MPDKPYQLVMKALLMNARDEVLMLRRSLHSENAPGKWELPGGKVDPWEDVVACLRREVLDETQLSITVDGVLTAFQGDSPERIFLYLVMHGRVKSGTLKLSNEHSDFRWVPRVELPNLDVSEHYRTFCMSYGKSL